MDPVSAGAAAVAAFGSIVGAVNSANIDNATRAELMKQLKKFDMLGIPVLGEMGMPDQLQSEVGALGIDPEMKAAQMQALAELKRVSDAGGHTLEDKAALQKTLNPLARQESAGRAAISNAMAARGQGGGGQEVAMMLQNQQGSADRAQSRGLDIAAQAQRRALEAMLSRGRLAGDIRGQDFAQRSAAAQARDMMNRYNAEGRQRAEAYNRSIPQQNFDNQYKLTAGRAGMVAPVVAQGRYDAQNAANTGANTGQVLSEGIKFAADAGRSKKDTGNTGGDFSWGGSYEDEDDESGSDFSWGGDY